MKIENVTVISSSSRGEYHHMPDNADRPELEGMTIRTALKTLRGIYWGDLGGMCGVSLSDGTYLGVHNRPAYGGGELTGTQQADRYDMADGGPRIIRRYNL